MAGDEVTGASTFRLEAGLDTGPVFGTVTEPIGPRDTAGDLLGRLAGRGAGLLVATLDGIAAGTPRGRAAARRGHQPRAADRARRRAGRLVAAGATSSTGGSAASPPHRAPGRRWRGERLRLGPVQPLPRGRPGWPPASSRCEPRRRPRRHRAAAPSASATCSRPASGCSRRPTGPAARGRSPASGWARDQAPARPPRPEAAGAAIRPTRRPVLDGARLTAYDVLDGVSSRAAYANLLLPQLLRERRAGRARRRVRHPAGLRHPARAGHPRRRPDAAWCPDRWPSSIRGCSTCSGWAPTS